jgi:hypothetical protein
MLRRTIWPLILLFVLITPMEAQESINYTRFDVQIVVQEDGNFIVREFHHLHFNGRFTQGFAVISLD